MKAVLLLLIVAFVHVAVAQLGSITVSFKDEDPATGNNVDAIITLGESLEVTLTLNPAPFLPIRLDVVSSLPDIIKVSHSRITFNKGETKGVITLESPPDGKIGVATIIVTPEKPGIYMPITFNILVQGYMSIDFVDPNACAGVSVPEMVWITVSPPSPETIEIEVSAVGGDLDSSFVSIPLGHTSVSFPYTGSVIGASSISAKTDLYVATSFSFNTLGTFITAGPTQMIQNAPSEVSVRVTPFDSDDLPNIFVSGSNAIVSPAAFTLSSSGTSTIEVIPVFSGSAAVTFSANGYCPKTDEYEVALAPVCDAGFIPNISATECVQCPGNDMHDPSISCNNEGTCDYSKCYDNSAVCFCFFPFIGYACQIDSINGDHFDQAVLDSSQFKLVLDDLDHTTGPTKFLAPGNLIRSSFQNGRAIVSGYHAEEPFFGAVNPQSTAPGTSVFSGIGWNWENTCNENTLIEDDFLTAAVSVKLDIVPEAFTHLEILQVGLYVWNTKTLVWDNSGDACVAAGFPRSVITVDLYHMDIVTDFCKPGQYAIFIVPNSAPIANTGNTNPPHPTLDQMSGTSAGTGRTGWQAAPPLPRPVDEDLSAYNPSLKIDSSSNASIIQVSVGILLVALMMI